MPYKGKCWRCNIPAMLFPVQIKPGYIGVMVCAACKEQIERENEEFEALEKKPPEK